MTPPINELILSILQIGLRINRETSYAFYSEFSGHMNTLGIIVYYAKSQYNRKEYAHEISLNHDGVIQFTEQDVINNLCACREKLEELLNDGH
jgi:hypothetical protein